MRISERPPALAVVEKTNPPVGAGPNDDVLGDAILFNSVMLEFYLRNLVPGLFKGLLSGRKKFSFASFVDRGHASNSLAQKVNFLLKDWVHAGFFNRDPEEKR